MLPLLVQPVFQLNLVLENGVVEYKPTVVELTHSVNDVSRALLSVISVVPRVEEVLPAEVQSYNATEAGIAALAAKTAAASGGFGGAAAQRAAAAAAEAKEGDASGPAAPAVPLQPTFYDVISNEPVVRVQLEAIMSGVTSNTKSLQEHKATFASYSHLWETDKGRFMSRYAKTSRPLAQVEADVMRFVNTESDIRASVSVSEK
jgi:hypothetical protein